MIEVEGLQKRFGGFQAVNVDRMTFEAGAITGLIGPNGAGKSTLFNVIAGVLAPTAGSVVMEGTVITGLPPTRSLNAAFCGRSRSRMSFRR